MKIAKIQSFQPFHFAQAKRQSDALQKVQEFVKVYRENRTVLGLHDEWGIIYSSETLQFWQDLYTALYEAGGSKYLQPFDWPNWQDEGYEYVMHPERLQTADLKTLCKLYILHERKDRFVGGHIASMIASGHIAALVDRLTELKESFDCEHSNF